MTVITSLFFSVSMKLFTNKKIHISRRPHWCLRLPNSQPAVWKTLSVRNGSMGLQLWVEDGLGRGADKLVPSTGSSWRVGKLPLAAAASGEVENGDDFKSTQRTFHIEWSCPDSMKSNRASEPFQVWCTHDICLEHWSNGFHHGGAGYLTPCLCLRAE